MKELRSSSESEFTGCEDKEDRQSGRFMIIAYESGKSFNPDYPDSESGFTGCEYKEDYQNGRLLSESGFTGLKDKEDYQSGRL